MNSIRTMVTVGISVFVAATAMAKTVNIRVTLNGSCRTLIHAEALEAILDGDEAAPLHLKQQEDRFHWSYDWDDRRKPAFPDARISASLRLEGARTYCRWSEDAHNKDSRDVPIANFTFTCDAVGTNQVTVDTKSNTAVAYVRRLPNFFKTPLDCDCEETAVQPGKSEIRDVRFPGEQLLLQLGRDSADPKAPGLLVFAKKGGIPSLLIPGRSTKEWLIGSALDTTYAKKPGDVLTVMKDGIVKALYVQRFFPRGDFSAPAIKLDEMDLRDMDAVAITVTTATQK